MLTTLARPTLARPSLAPVTREVPADLETPVSAYLKLARGPYCYLLESVEGGERLARFSFVGVDPYLVLTLHGTEAELRWSRRVRRPSVATSGDRASRLAKAAPGFLERRPCRDPLDLIQEELVRRHLEPVPGGPAFVGGAVGYLAYEVASRFEPRVTVPAADPLGLPEAVFLFTDTLLIFDHVRHHARLIAHPDLEAAGGDPDRAQADAARRLDILERRLRGPVPRPRTNLATGASSAASPGSASTPGAPADAHAGSSRLEPRDAYEAAVRRARDHIQAGDCFQIVPSRRIARPVAAPSFAVYRALRSINPSPYMFYLALGDFEVAGASPEVLVRVADGEVAIHPIAGTRRRGATPEEDAALEAELRGDEKERAEHVMLVDLGRNDVGRVSEPGSVRVTRFMDVERYSHVMHLVSHVTGRLRADLTPFDALRAGFPAGTVSGAPKIRAMEVIAELEGERRGVYAGAVGYFGFDGNLDTCIPLRTLVLKDGVAYAQAGGGVVYDSEPGFEYEESENKLRALFRALEEAEKRCSC
jgi:anthranilate synthase component 1